MPVPAFPSHDQQALFILLSGPSGAGKSTLMRRLTEVRPDIIRCLSVTTRAPRGTERHGIDYIFLTEAEFDQRIDDGDLLEHATVFGKHRYGTPRGFVEQAIASGHHVIKDIDVQGAQAIRRSFPNGVQIFVVPPSREEIRQRLQARGTESSDAMQRRLEEAERELAHWRLYDYLVINRDIEATVSDLVSIIEAERLRIKPIAERRLVDLPH